MTFTTGQPSTIRSAWPNTESIPTPRDASGFERDGQVYVGLEGKMFIGGARGPTNVPYPIPYRAITPQGRRVH